MLSEEAYELLRQAGAVARRVRSEASSVVREGVDALTISEFIEERIHSHGARPAFPCNVGINSVAAHYSPTRGSEVVVPHGSIVKIDLGVEIEGFIADTAITIALPGSDPLLVEAAEEALRAALRVMRSGVKASEIGRAVQSVVTQAGYKPIRNLSGHEIQRFNLHAGLSIPNVQTSSPARLPGERVYAIEPFVTLRSAAGEVVNSDLVNIYSLPSVIPNPSRLSEDERRLIERIREVSRGLPYSTRWLGSEFEQIHSSLIKRGIIHGYPVLVERTGAPVSQAEHTVILREDGCEVIT